MGQLELACFNAESTLLAEAAGVHRIELCSDRALGGITPPLALLEDLRSKIPSSMPINVMIRPRGSNFLYSDMELQEMIASIEDMKPYCNGFVFGILKADSTVDIENCMTLVERAHPLPCTFHRAFDETPDMLKALKDVTTCGFKTILTSGGPGNAIDNIEAILQLLHKTGRGSPSMTSTNELAREHGIASPGQVVIMVGGGLRSKDVAFLQCRTVRPSWYHTSAIVDKSDIADEQELVACRIQAEDRL